MDDTTLIRMANQIADFYAPYSEAESIEGIAQHIRSFWEPRMRSGLLEALNTRPDDIKPVVAKALQNLAGTAGN